jgi:hypothetical protein
METLTGKERIGSLLMVQPIEIKDQKMFDKTLDYIDQNPVLASFIAKPEEFVINKLKKDT